VTPLTSRREEQALFCSTPGRPGSMKARLGALNEQQVIDTVCHAYR
jgi:hypothetical protein